MSLGRSGGLRARPRTEEARVTATGRLVLKSPAYLRWLHQRLALGQLLRLSAPAWAGVVDDAPTELHHLLSGQGGARRDLDPMMCPVSRSYHQRIDLDWKTERRDERLQLEAAYLWWSYLNRDPATDAPASREAFALWCIRRTHEEGGNERVVPE